MNAHRYRKISSLIREVDPDRKELLQDAHRDIVESLEKIEAINRKSVDGSTSIQEAALSTTRFEKELEDLEEKEKRQLALSHALKGDQNLIHMLANLSTGFVQAWKILEGIASGLDAGELLVIDEQSDSTREKMQDLAAELSLNGDACVRFENACRGLGIYRHSIIDIASQITKVAEQFFVALSKRHSSEGIRIWHSPVLTDFSMSIYNNIAHHGNVTEQTTESQISAYSMRKAIAIIDWTRDEDFEEILTSDVFEFSYWIKRQLRKLWKTSKDLEDIFKDELKAVAQVHYTRVITPSDEAFDSKMRMLEELDPNKVKYEDRSATFSEEEIRNLEHKNEVLGKICSMLKDKEKSSHDIANYVYDQVKKLRQHYLEVNSFYVCKIGQGNPMMGQSSGALEVVPGKRPNSNFADIIGSGFDELRDFSQHIKRMQKFADLYLMTSPRRTHDRANVLLIGPQGCGKTEALRAVANDDDSIAIFAQGSDFLTSWMGEAQKNPKRLFEAAIKLQKESGRHIHILIDEIDSVANDDYSTTKINLTLEFQMIMDGVVEYPNISVWGTTNHPERIPMPMIRRFAKLLIVGKLDQRQRVDLLKHFFSNLPMEKISDEEWGKRASRLEHATGDVIRKIADHVWRSEISRFITDSPEEAEKMLDIIHRINYEAGQKYKAEVTGTRADREIDERLRGGGKTSRRKQFLKHLRQTFEIKKESVDKAINVALDNIGIINEMQTAKKTYEDAERFLADIKSERESRSQ